MNRVFCRRLPAVKGQSRYRRLVCVAAALVAGLLSSQLIGPAAIARGDQTTQSDPQPQTSVAVKTESRWLEDGISIERENRWAEAAMHYEQALREHPESTKLYQRMVISRLHHDVDRRYQDPSFLAAVREMGTVQALDLYSEVLANLETHYVDAVDWASILLRGTASLEVALTELRFKDRLLAGGDPARVENFRLTAHQRIANRSTATRFDLRATASHIATIAQQEIGLSPTAVVLEYIGGAVSTLDAYTRLLSPKQLDEMFSNIEGNFVGLGIELKARKDHLQILSVIPGGPAEQAGIRGGERIVSVSGQRTDSADPEYVADLLRGPEFSSVTLTVADESGAERRLTVPRRRVEVPSVENPHFVDVENRVGYFRLTNFQKTTRRDVERALWELHRQGRDPMRSLIIDLRGNPGGLLSAAVEVADFFLSQGTIVTTRGRHARENYEYVAHRTNTWSVPLAVLIDRDSASASEIFAGAIKDTGRGVVIGETSYGKGSVQGIFRMQSARFGLCLTTAKFYSPSGRAISQNGVVPKISVEPSYIAARPDALGRIMTDSDDAVLQTAVRQFTRSSVASLRPSGNE